MGRRPHRRRAACPWLRGQRPHRESLPPAAALRRPPSQSWRTFLRNHASSIWAADLCTVQTLAFRTLYVLIVIDHDRRRIRHWNVTEHPNAPWIWQQMIEATAWGQQPGFLIRDRDRSYGGDFIARARRIGIETILTPVRAPNANAIAERVIGTLRRECLDHVIAVNERHLRRVLHWRSGVSASSPVGRHGEHRLSSVFCTDSPRTASVVLCRIDEARG